MEIQYQVLISVRVFLLTTTQRRPLHGETKQPYCHLGSLSILPWTHCGDTICTRSGFPNAMPQNTINMELRDQGSQQDSWGHWNHYTVCTGCSLELQLPPGLFDSKTYPGPLWTSMKTGSTFRWQQLDYVSQTPSYVVWWSAILASWSLLESPTPPEIFFSSLVTETY